jgi:hypothetical protein
MPKTNRYKMTHRKRTLKRKNSKKHNNKQRGGDNYVWYLISGFKSPKTPELIMLNKPEKYFKRDLFLTWFTNDSRSYLNILFFGDTKFALEYHIGDGDGDGDGTVDNPYKVQLYREAYGIQEEQFNTSERNSRYSSSQLPFEYSKVFKKPKGRKLKSRKEEN